MELISNKVMIFVLGAVTAAQSQSHYYNTYGSYNLGSKTKSYGGSNHG